MYTVGERIWILLLCGFLGACAGSFIDCISLRISRHEDWIRGYSRCDHCGHRLYGRDLLPVFSYLLRRGRCRYCDGRIDPESFVVEIIMWVLFDVYVLRYGIGMRTIQYMVLTLILAGVSLVDMKTYEIPDGFHIGAVINLLVTLPFISLTWVNQLKEGLPAGILLAGGILIVSMVFARITGKEGIGGGDIKLYFVTGMYLGLLKGIISMMISCVIGLICMICTRKEKLAFGPSIACALIISLLAGDYLLSLYTGMFL